MDNQLQGWVRRTLQSALFNESKMPSLLAEASQYRPLTSVCHSSGAAVALSTGWIWKSLTPAYQMKRAALIKVWKQSLNLEIKKLRAQTGKAKFPAGLEKSALLVEDWTQRLEGFWKHLTSMQENEAHMHLHCAKLAVRLTLHGFRGVDDLAGLQDKAITRISEVPREQTLLAKIVKEVDFLASQARVERLRRRLGMPEPSQGGPKSAHNIAGTLTVQRLGSLEESNRELQGQLGLSFQAGPRAVTEAMAVAKQKGQTKMVQEALADREEEIRLQGQRKSLPQVAAGLRAWHGFAVTVLNYDDAATIPPDSTDASPNSSAAFQMETAQPTT